jgi:spore germination cell wall hydrolase CwlJ-like protein
MYYSQTIATVDVAKTWKMLLAALSLIFIWQVFTTQSHAGIQFDNLTDSDIIVEKTTQTPAEAQQQTFREKWDNARFLAVVETPEKIRYSQNDLFCMAKNIYHEAGNQSRLGKFAVAQVTINRMKHPDFSGSVCDVVFAPYQFSWANNRRVRWTRPRPNEMWNDSLEVAKEALQEGFRVKGMQNAIFYHANYVNPRWRRVERLTQIGAHIFYTKT